MTSSSLPSASTPGPDHAAPTRQPSYLQFSSRMYNLLKFCALVFFPAVATLYFALAGIWGLPYAEKIIGSIAAFDTFLGVVLHLSSVAYNSAIAASPSFGTINVSKDQSGKKLFSLEVNGDPNDLDKQRQVTFKVNPTG